MHVESVVQLNVVVCCIALLVVRVYARESNTRLTIPSILIAPNKSLREDIHREMSALKVS